MSKKSLILIISLCLVGAIFVLTLNQQLTKTQASGGTEMFERIDGKALTAQGGGASAIGDLVDTIFSENGINQLDANLIASLKDRLVRAELNGQGIPETQVVQAFNWFANQYSMPTYARTSLLQTRTLRLGCSGIMPNFFVDEDSSGNIGMNKSVNSELPSNVSPTQAITLIILMVHQKVLNEGFQKEPAQWDSDFYAEQQTGSNYPQGGGSPELVGRISSQKTNQMRQIVYGTIFSPTDQENLAQGLLDQLGIPR